MTPSRGEGAIRGSRQPPGRPRLAASRGQRRLFPPPLLPADSTCSGRERERSQIANDALLVLNWMAGSKDFCGLVTAPTFRPMTCRRTSSGGRVSWLTAGTRATPSRATRRLSRSCFEGTPRIRRLGARQGSHPSSSTSWACLARCGGISDVAPPEVIDFLGDYHVRMLAPPIDVFTTAPYFDPVLRFNQKEYHRLLRRLAEIGIIT